MQSDGLAPSQKYDFYAHGLAGGHNDIFSAFLGPAAREAKTTPYAKKATAKWNMPENYIGQNEFLGDTMEDFMLTAKWDWYTERILPWYKTDNIHLQWTEWENNPHYMGITPHQATSRVITQRRTIRRASIVRRGIAYEFENDFVGTPMGRSSFMASLAQMARSVQETANVEVLRALLHCHRYQQVYVRKHGIVADGDLDGWLDRKAERFMIAQKTQFGLEILNTQIEAEQEMYQAQANVWILGREVMDYCSVVPPEKIFYNLGGQEAVNRVNGRPQNGSAAGDSMGNVRSLQPERMIGTTAVYLAKSYHVDSIGRAELLSRLTETGVYNLMCDRTKDYSKYSSEGRNIRVYDNDIDSWSDIELLDAVENCGVWADDGSLENIFGASGRAGSKASAAALADEDYDFLSFKDYTDGGRRKNIEYIGDMSPVHLKTHNLENAAKTVLNAMAHHDPAGVKELVKNYDVDGGMTEDVKERVLKILCGNKNMLSRSEKFDVRTGVRAEPVLPNISSEHEETFLRKVLGVAVPAKHAAKLESIISEEDSWQNRAKAIKELVLDCKKADPDSLKSFPNTTHIDKWYTTSVDGFKSKLASVAKQQPIEKSAKASPVTKLSELPAFQAHVEKHHSSGSGSSAGGRLGAASRRGRIGAMAQAPGAKFGGGAPAVTDSKKLAEEMAEKRYYNMKQHYDNLTGSSAHEIIKDIAKMYLGVPINRDCFTSFVSNHIYIPLGFLLMRPHATYKTRYGIKCAAGGKSGYTFFGHSNMQIEHEAARKVGMMHYTAYLSAVVMHPKNVYVVEDLFCEKYMGGMGVEFWKAKMYKSKLQKRNSRSIICAPLPPNYKKIERKIDVRGRWYTEQRLGLVTQDRFEKPLYPGAGRINFLFGLYDGGRKDKSSNRGRIPINFVCWQGHTWFYNTVTQRFDDFVVEAGPMGSKVYPGCGLVRNGAMKYLKDPNYENVHV